MQPFDNAMVAIENYNVARKEPDLQDQGVNGTIGPQTFKSGPLMTVDQTGHEDITIASKEPHVSEPLRNFIIAAIRETFLNAINRKPDLSTSAKTSTLRVSTDS